MGGSSLDVWSDVTNPLGEIPRHEAVQQQKNALEKQKIEANLQAINQKEQRADQLERVVSSADAQQSARGLSLGSGSFKAIQDNNFNQFAKEENVINMNNQFRQEAISQQISNINKMNRLDDFETVFAEGFKVAGSFFGIKSGFGSAAKAGSSGAAAGAAKGAATKGGVSKAAGKKVLGKASAFGDSQAPTTTNSTLPGYDNASNEALQNAFDSSSDQDFPDAFSNNDENS
jgi:hypothetical protein